MYCWHLAQGRNFTGSMRMRAHIYFSDALQVLNRLLWDAASSVLLVQVLEGAKQAEQEERAFPPRLECRQVDNGSCQKPQHLIQNKHETLCPLVTALSSFSEFICILHLYKAQGKQLNAIMKIGIYIFRVFALF